MQSASPWFQPGSSKVRGYCPAVPCSAEKNRDVRGQGQRVARKHKAKSDMDRGVYRTALLSVKGPEGQKGKSRAKTDCRARVGT